MMLYARTLPALIILVLMCLSFPLEANAHRTFGLFYPESNAGEITRSELEWLAESGISRIMVEERLSELQRELVADSGFNLFVMVPAYYVIPARLGTNGIGYYVQARELLEYYRDEPSVEGFGLMAYSIWQQNAIPEQLEQLAGPYLGNRTLFTLDSRPMSGDRLHPFDGIVMMTRSAEALALQLEQEPDLAGILYDPERREIDIRDFQDVLELMEPYRDLPVFFEQSWFKQNSDRDPAHETTDPDAFASDLSQITAFYRNIPDARVANPPPDTSGNDLDFSVLLLFMLWATFTAYYRLNPMYRKSVARFFFNYYFFVNDILMRRIRLPGDAALLFVLSSFVAGLMALATAQMYFDSVALGALLSYLPLIPADWTHPVFLFWYFFFLTMLINGLLIAWLRIANSQHSQTYQVATLFLWPQHLNIVVVSAGVILLRPFPSEKIVVGMFLIFWTITLASFILTAYDMRRIYPTSPYYMASTYALFVLIVTFLLFWLIFMMDVITAWNLAVSIIAS